MGSSDLVGRLDFNPGKDFQDEVYHRFGSTVHFNSSPSGSFFLLATFRRFLFRLTEESIALTLQSCLGGSADKFHVKFLSTNHFRFSVASKHVSFLIYKLRRVISSSFDVYFHLWNNGTAHWEREKRAWEIEQEKEWTTVLSKSAKRQAKAKAKDQNPVPKKVRFAQPLVQYPRHVIQFGAFRLVVVETKVPPANIFGSRTNPGRSVLPCSSPCMQRSTNSGGNSTDSRSDPLANAISNTNGCLANPIDSVCPSCLVPGHNKDTWKGQLRCKYCYNYGTP